jgi:hypothetical protein
MALEDKIYRRIKGGIYFGTSASRTATVSEVGGNGGPLMESPTFTSTTHKRFDHTHFHLCRVVHPAIFTDGSAATERKTRRGYGGSQPCHITTNERPKYYEKSTVNYANYSPLSKLSWKTPCGR